MATTTLTSNQREILDHTARRAANGNYCGDSEDMQSLVAMGLMEYAGRVPFCSDKFFCLTPLGRKSLRGGE